MDVNLGTILGSVLVLALGCNPCAALEGTEDNVLAKLTLGTRGTSTTFVKWQEIEIRDSLPHGRRPVPTETAVRNLSKYDAIWCANFVPTYNIRAWRRLRRQHPNLLTLYYMSSDTTQGPGVNPFDYEYISTHHPEWFVLRDAKDPTKADPRDPFNRVRWSTDPKNDFYDRFFLDVCNPSFQKWAAAYIVDLVSGRRQKLRFPYSGYAADNVNIGRKALQMIARRGANWTYADRTDEWNAGFCEYLRTVRKALNERGFILVVNHSLEYGADVDAEAWDLFLDSIDGVMTERPIGYGRVIYTDDAWLMSIEKHERILDKGLIDWWDCYPPAEEPAGRERFLYTYCSWLLVKRPGRSFFFSTKGDPGYRTNPVVPWYREYDLPIGAAASGRHREGACWARRYTNALVVVNPTRETQSVRLARNITWIDASSEKPVSVVQMPPTSGRILLSGPARVQPE